MRYCCFFSETSHPFWWNDKWDTVACFGNFPSFLMEWRVRYCYVFSETSHPFLWTDKWETAACFRKLPILYDGMTSEILLSIFWNFSSFLMDWQVRYCCLFPETSRPFWWTDKWDTAACFQKLPILYDGMSSEMFLCIFGNFQSFLLDWQVRYCYVFSETSHPFWWNDKWVIVTCFRKPPILSDEITSEILLRVFGNFPSFLMDWQVRYCCWFSETYHPS